MLSLKYMACIMFAQRDRLISLSFNTVDFYGPFNEKINKLNSKVLHRFCTCTNTLKKLNKSKEWRNSPYLIFSLNSLCLLSDTHISLKYRGVVSCPFLPSTTAVKANAPLPLTCTYPPPPTPTIKIWVCS